MADTQETITDIIAEKRRRADEIERECAEKMKRGEMVSDCYARELVADIRREADRLEAALKRELESVPGDTAKLREALSATLDMIFDLQVRHRSPIANSVYAVRRKIWDALDAPPRNCDTGTAEEQFERWQAFCNRYDPDCKGCPCDGPECSFACCFAKWAQMPYEEGAVK